MGQAKNRGTFEQRLNSAPPLLPKNESFSPSYIACSQCGDHLTDFVSVPQMVVSGLSAVYVAFCEDCDFFSFHLVPINKRDTLGILNFVQCLECEAARLD
jgi:hypothetical protein